MAVMFSSQRRSQRTRNRVRGAFSVIEALTAGTILAGFALSTTWAFSMANRIASTTRNRVVAASVVHGYLDEALASDWTSTVTPPILAITAAGTDIDGDGVAYAGNVPLLTMRDTQVSNLQKPVLTGTVYRQCLLVNSTLKIVRVSFLIGYSYRGKNYHYRMTALKAQEQ